MQRRLALVCIVTLLCGAGAAIATPLDMQKLPASTANRCLNCHSQQSPTSGNATLNVFGTAFQQNGRQWNAALALQRSDGDNCTNGFELGDVDGDGRLDAGVTAERSNPGENDCTLQLNEQAWSAIKKLFR